MEQNMSVNEIRDAFLKFFESKDHYMAGSFPLVPQNDKSLLLINAGMAPLKNYFMGVEKPPKKRMTTCQKCIRTGDIENVGRTARHATYFEMLGNFSFGDYFKKDAITWAWEFVTEVLKLDKDKLWVTVYEDDDDAFKLWEEIGGISSSKIVRLGKEDNFWEIGNGTGPCGPCSEIYIDRGEKFGCGSPDCKPGCDCDRFLEFWNLVFTQFDRQTDGSLKNLPHPNIDTGMGLERIACIMQNVESIFDIDTMRHIIKKIEDTLGVSYETDEEKDVSIRIIADHIRAVTFMISDGIIPSNEGRGYVLRRLLRRAAQRGKLLGSKAPFLSDISDSVIEINKDAYPGLFKNADRIKKVIQNEEEKFEETIYAGLEILKQKMYEMKTHGETELNSEVAFKLYDTFGFPFDLTKEILKEQGYTVNEDDFDAEMEKQRQRARLARKGGEVIGWKKDNEQLLNCDATPFLGYDSFVKQSVLKTILVDDDVVDVVKTGDKAIFILNETPFYGESGGQVGDTGILEAPNGKIKVTDTKKTPNKVIMHIGEVIEGTVKVNDTLISQVNGEHRKSVMRNHSATHLLHKALKTVLGSHVHQAGSLVTPERLRFDFTHFEPVSAEELDKVEILVNKIISADLNVKCKEMKIDEARSIGAEALFGEKYGDIVRVVEMGDFSLELCGGTHVTHTSDIGLFKIISENGVASGVRRIEAVTGHAAYEYTRSRDLLIKQMENILKSNSAQLIDKLNEKITENKNLQKELDSLKKEIMNSKASDATEKIVSVGNVHLLAAELDEFSNEDMRNFSEKLIDKDSYLITVFASKNADKVSFVSMAGKDAVKNGADSGKLLREVAKIAGGGGGGRADRAEAGGKDASKTAEAIRESENILKNMLK